MNEIDGQAQAHSHRHVFSTDTASFLVTALCGSNDCRMNYPTRGVSMIAAIIACLIEAPTKSCS